MKSFYYSLCLLCILFAEPPPSSARLLHIPVSEREPLFKGINAPARVDVRGSWDLSFSASALYWQAREEGLDIAKFNDNTISSGVVGRVLNPRFAYRWGIQASLGFLSAADDWETKFQYTRFHFSAKTRYVAPTGGSLLIHWLSNVPEASSADARWKVKLDLLDYYLGRDFMLGNKLQANISVGARSMLQKQKYNITAFVDSVSIEIDSRNKQKVWALGPLIHIASVWNSLGGFYFAGHINTSLIYCNYRTSVEAEDATSSTIIFKAKVKERAAHLHPNIDTKVGLGWGRYFSHYRWHIDTFIAYDCLVFFQQNAMRAVSDNALISTTHSNFGDLGIQGFSARLQFHF